MYIIEETLKKFENEIEILNYFWEFRFGLSEEIQNLNRNLK